MFRSWGEFRSCATDVFHLFAEAPHHGDAGLSRAGLECAYYVLLGHYPSSSLLSDCFTSTPSLKRSPRALPQLSLVPPPALASTSTRGAGATIGLDSGDGEVRISLSAYLRFITLCAEQEGPSLVVSSTHEPQALTTQVSSSYSPLVHATGAQAATLQGWRQFESVAGKKGFITLCDMSSLPMQHPFEDVDDVLQTAGFIGPPSQSASRSGGTAEESAESSRRRQRAVAQHVFWIMDRDRDGKVRFEDVKPYLLNSA